MKKIHEGCINSSTTRQEALKIAELVHKEIISFLKEYEDSGTECRWGDYIIVDGWGFGYYELEENNFGLS